VHNFGGFVAARAFLGLSEGGLYPAVIYFLSCWYKRSELGIRMAVFVSAASLSGSFGGLLATAIARMDGVGGKPGWAWIFILEGLVTVVLGVISFWMVQDFPTDATFLTDEERKRVLRRLALDQQSSARDEAWKWGYLSATLLDWKTYVGALTYAGAGASVYAFSLFVPTIIKDLVTLPHSKDLCSNANLNRVTHQQRHNCSVCLHSWFRQLCLLVLDT